MAVDRSNLMEALRQPATTNGYPAGRTAASPRVGLMELMAGVVAATGPSALWNTTFSGAN